MATNNGNNGRPKKESNGSQMSQHKKKFIEGYIVTGTVTHGAEYAGINARTVYRWLEKCPAFVEEFNAAKDAVGDGLEKEAIRRAKAGSDVLLIFLLKGNRPEKYREKTQHELIGAGGEPIRHVVEVVDQETKKALNEFLKQ